VLDGLVVDTLGFIDNKVNAFSSGLAFFDAVEEAFVGISGPVYGSGNQGLADGYDVILTGTYPGGTDADAPIGLDNADDPSLGLVFA
jgi:hypothetical protein